MECRYRRAGARGGGRAAFPSWRRARLCPGRRRILGSGWQAEGRVESRGRDDVTAEARLCAQEREPDTAAESPRRASLSDWGHQAAAGLRATHLLNDENAYRLPVPFFCHAAEDRKSTRLNSSHGYISYAVFCLKKKKKNTKTTNIHTNNYHNATFMCA